MYRWLNISVASKFYIFISECSLLYNEECLVELTHHLVQLWNCFSSAASNSRIVFCNEHKSNLFWTNCSCLSPSRFVNGFVSFSCYLLHNLDAYLKSDMCWRFNLSEYRNYPAICIPSRCSEIDILRRILISTKWTAFRNWIYRWILFDVTLHSLHFSLSLEINKINWHVRESQSELSFKNG